MAGTDVSKMATLMLALQSKNNDERKEAENLFLQAKTTEPSSLIVGLLALLADSTADEAVKRQAAVLLRQLVSQGQEKDFAFSRITPEEKQKVAGEVLNLFKTLGETQPKVQQKVGDVLNKLAESVFDDEDQRGWLAPGQVGWPVLLPTIFQMADATTNTTVASCESAIRLLKDLVSTCKKDIVGAQAHIGNVVQNALANPDTKIRVAGFALVCEMVGELEKKAWAPLMATTSVLCQVLKQLCDLNLQEELEECLQNFVEVASVEPDFFKKQLTSTFEPAQLLTTIVKTREGIEEGVRNASMEWMVTYATKKPKWLAKNLPNFAAVAMECCMELMLEVEDGEAELKAWTSRMDDEEGEEDFDSAYHTGQDSIDRIAEAFTMESIGTSFFPLVAKFAQQSQWQAKLAALTAVKQTVEYVEDTQHVNEMANLLFMHMDHPHPRVRYIALQALGQLANDQAPQFQDGWHGTVMPILLQKMDDPIDRVASMAMTAFVSFGSDLENALMLGYSSSFMQKLVERLTATSHRMVQEESITSIAVIAGVIEKDFAQYYDGIMPLLKRLVLNATGEKESRLRGKAFECMSLLGCAVGKEKFLPDAQEAVAEMLKTPGDADDLQREYIKEASGRICECLKESFAPFLPHLLPRIFKSLTVEDEEAEDGDLDDDDEKCVVVCRENKVLKIRTSKVDELMQSIQLIETFCEQMEGAYLDFVPQTAEALLPLLSDNIMTTLVDEARSNAFQAWAALIKVARTGAKDRGQPPDLASELLRTFLQRTCANMQKDDDPETLRDSADGLTECLKSVGTGVLNSQEVLQLAEQLFKFIDDSFKRGVELQKEKEKDVAGAPQELQNDEDDNDETGQEDEELCRRSFEDAMGAVMEAAPQEFLQCLPECSRRIGQWLTTKENRVLALFLACDLLEHLKEHSEPAWPVFMPAVFQALGDADAEVRTPAAFAVSLAAPLAKFGEAAPEAFKVLATLVSGPAPKKRETSGKLAMDNCVSALLALARGKGEFCPPDVPAWQLIVNKLPLTTDEDEAKKVHRAVCTLVLEQHAGLLGPDHGHIGKILSALAEVYHQEELCNKETEADILRIFQHIPQEKLQSLAGNFTEKQQKKIEKMLTPSA
eukprot:CAMPEP_0179310970 /NCGR_PEP_ID=MMETSP0797-20121207/52443_1 /TAXON_ID=47934 /ORGANISM="Dinophysis acuminata, Strain DAEP01" /LENGTH=1117 /DNA_ID=CAMNT_0021020725 /DNA_START=60 /DNA_END=3413 /DNA_ORIENTATION=-